MRTTCERYGGGSGRLYDQVRSHVSLRSVRYDVFVLYVERELDSHEWYLGRYLRW